MRKKYFTIGLNNVSLMPGQNLTLLLVFRITHDGLLDFSERNTFAEFCFRDKKNVRVGRTEKNVSGTFKTCPEIGSGGLSNILSDRDFAQNRF